MEGAITVCVGIWTLFLLPQTPMKARFLSEEGKAAAVARLKLDAQGAGKESDVEAERFNWTWVRIALLNWSRCY